MFIKQISVFVENKKGRLHSLTKTLADNGIDLKALSIADTSNFGILRCIVNDPIKALDIIKSANFTASVTEVLAVEVEDNPGGLAKVLEALMESEISVEYLYSFVGTHSENALIIFRVDELQKAFDALKNRDVKILSEEVVYNL